MSKVRNDNDVRAVPYHELRRLVHILREIDPCSNTTLMTEVLFVSGCRIKELEDMLWHLLKDEVLWWYLGKNQKGRTRHVHMSKDWLKRYQEYRDNKFKNHKERGEYLFDIKSASFARRFQKIRKLMLQETPWSEKKDAVVGGEFYEAHLYTLSGFRKSWVTLMVARHYDVLGDMKLAIQAVRKLLKHSSENITEYHYVQDMHKLDMNKWRHFDPWEILNLTDYEVHTRSGGQTSLHFYTNQGVKGL